MIKELLLQGKEKGTHGDVLAAILNTDIRQVCFLIEQERRAGVPICADTKTGYYLPENPEELMRYIKALHGRGCEIQKTYRLMKEAYNNIYGAEQTAGEVGNVNNEEVTN